MWRYRYDQDGWPWSRSTASPSAGPSSTYAWRSPSISTYSGAYGQSRRSSKQASGVRTNSTPISVAITVGSASHGIAAAVSVSASVDGSSEALSLQAASSSRPRVASARMRCARLDLFVSGPLRTEGRRRSAVGRWGEVNTGGSWEVSHIQLDVIAHAKLSRRSPAKRPSGVPTTSCLPVNSPTATSFLPGDGCTRSRARRARGPSRSRLFEGHRVRSSGHRCDDEIAWSAARHRGGGTECDVLHESAERSDGHPVHPKPRPKNATRLGCPPAVWFGTSVTREREGHT